MHRVTATEFQLVSAPQSQYNTV